MTNPHVHNAKLRDGTPVRAVEQLLTPILRCIKQQEELDAWLEDYTVSSD